MAGSEALVHHGLGDAVQDPELLLGIIDNTATSIWVKDLEGRYLLVNRRHEQFWGLTRDAMLGRTDTELFPPNVAEEFRVGDLEVLERDAPIERETNQVSPVDGELHTFAMTKFPLHDARGTVFAVCGIRTDITERARAEEAVRSAEARLRNLVEQLPFVTYAVRFDTGAPVYVSPQVEQLFGYTVEEWLEETPSFEESLYAQLLHPDDRERVLSATREAHGRGETYGGEYRMIGRDGRLIWVRDVSTVVRDEQGRPLMSQGIFLDVTAERAAEADRERLEAELRQAQKLEAIGRLAGGVAHDFNNVLTAIRGYSEFLAEGLPEGTTLRADAEEIRRAADRAGGLTRQLLAFSRRQMLQMQNVDLNEIVSDMDKLLRRLIGADIELVTLLAPELERVEADLGQLEQVIINLALNARDAMPSGGRLVIQTANVTVTEPVLARHPSLEPGDYVTVTVRDSGIGMGDKTTSHIFEPFFTTKDLGKGTGLGLSTVYGIVEQSGGRIFVYSDPGRGTTFKIYLPASTAEGLPSAAPAPVVSSVRGSETILLVEDDEVLRTLAARTLREQGYQVLEARYASEALELSSEQKGEIDALVSDVVMPGMSGVELAERLASERPGIRIVLMSGFTDEAVAHHTHATSPVAFLDKPFPPSKLLRVVRETLENA